MSVGTCNNSLLYMYYILLHILDLLSYPSYTVNKFFL